VGPQDRALKIKRAAKLPIGAYAEHGGDIAGGFGPQASEKASNVPCAQSPPTRADPLAIVNFRAYPAPAVTETGVDRMNGAQVQRRLGGITVAPPRWGPSPDADT